MNIYQETPPLLFRKPPETLLTFEPWVLLQEVMLKEMLRENNCKAWAVAELCSDFLLTFGFLTMHVKAWLQVLLRKRVPSSGKAAWCWGRRSSFVKVAECSEPEQYVQAVWRDQHEWMDMSVGCGWGCLGASCTTRTDAGAAWSRVWDSNLSSPEEMQNYRNHTLSLNFFSICLELPFRMNFGWVIKILWRSGFLHCECKIITGFKEIL